MRLIPKIPVIGTNCYLVLYTSPQLMSINIYNLRNMIEEKSFL